MQKPTAARYYELDALRGLAALSVVLFHFTMFRKEAGLGFNLGFTGVDLFFMISGFVIYMSLIHLSTTKEFIINRFTRLFPTYWACVSFTFALSVLIPFFTNVTDSIPFGDYLANLTMFQCYLNIPNIDGPYWTMPLEMTFYILIAILFATDKMKYIIPVSLFLMLVIAFQFVLEGTAFWPGYRLLRIYLPLLDYFCLFFAGILFYKLTVDPTNTVRYYALISLAFILQAATTSDVGPFVTQTEHVVMLFVYFLVFLLFVNQKLRFIAIRPLLFLGKISFALYLIHQYVSTVVILPFLIQRCHLSFWSAALVAMIIVILLASFVTFYFELIFGKKLNNYLRHSSGLQAR